MNRTGLYIALTLFTVIGLTFGFYPELDLKLAALFYDPASQSFPIKTHEVAMFARDAAMWICWAFVLPSIVALITKLIWPNRKLLISGNTIAFLLITITLAAGILTNLTFKSHWSRPRPVMVSEFSGPWQFKAWWDPTGECGRNCSFFSGESATAFWTLAPAALTPPAWRPIAYAGALAFGALTSVLRMAFGGHFFTDVTIAGLVTFLVIWLVHGWIFRWPATRKTDAEVDATLTRFAWPGYRWRRKWRGRDVGPVPNATETARLDVR